MATIYQNGIQYSGSGEPLIYDDMGGATSTTGGVHGLVPAPSAGDNEKFLSGDGSWKSAGEYITKTASGNPIELTDGADAPMVKCVTEITGSQDLHGYDKPWVGGAGKNKLPLVLSDIKTLNTSGTWSGDDYTVSGVTFVVNTDGDGNITSIKATGTPTYNAILNFVYGAFSTSQNMILNGCPSGGGESTYQIDVTGSSTYYQDSGSGVSIPSGLENKTVRIRISSDNGSLGNGVTFYPMLRLSTETDPTFAPYSNICPITAYTEGEIEVRGKNLFDANGFVSSYSSNYQIASDGSVETISNLLVNNVFWNNTDDYEGNLTISYKYKYINTGSVGLRLEINYADGTSETVSTTNSQTYNTITKTTTKKVSNIVTDYGSATNKTNFYLMVVTGDRAYDYEPYTSTTHTTTFPSAIYRGSEDVVEGEVTSEWGIYVINEFTGTVEANGFRTGITLPNFSRAYGELYCNMFGRAGSYNEAVANENLPEQRNKIGYNGAGLLLLNAYVNGAYVNSINDLNALIPSEGCVIAYPLATPTTSSVTPTNLPIKSLSGYTHIESSTGDMEVEYITSEFQPIVDLIESNKHVYSTAEQIVGTWIDGKTVYEMAVTNLSVSTSGTNWASFNTIDASTWDNIIDAKVFRTLNSGKMGALPIAEYAIIDGHPNITLVSNLFDSVVTTAIFTYTKATAQTRALSSGSLNISKGEISGEKKKVEETPIEEEKPVENEEEK